MDISRRDEILEKLNTVWDKIHDWDNREIEYIERMQKIIRTENRSLTYKEEQEWNDLCNEYEKLLEELDNVKKEHEEFNNPL